MEVDVVNISRIYKANTEIINKSIADVSDNDWLRSPGNDSNHLLWLLGHVIVHRAYVLKALGMEWSSSWAPLFARGAEKVEEGEYPTVEEMREAWTQMSAKLREALRQPTAELLEQPPPEGLPSFDNKVSGTLAFFAFHDAYHTGQLSYLHKWLGYGQTIG